MKYRRISKEVKLTTFTALVLAVFILPALFLSLFLVNDSYATASSISISLSGAPTVNIASSSEGKFADSGNSTITITTTHAAGYTLTAKASNSTNLEGVNGGSIPSITSAVSPTNYADNTYASSHNLNDTWAYKPSVLYNASTQATNPNTDYLPSPGTGTAQSPIDTLAVTNDANDGSYTVSIGARVTTATAIDEYSNSFIFAVVGNPTPYAITYNKNTTDTVTNIPTNHTTSDPGTTDETVTIDSTVPVRDGYDFKGWCSTATSDDTCSGTVYNPDGGGTSLNLTINQTSSTNAFTLYAMWKRNKIYMQTMTADQCVTGSPTTVYDNRDEESYEVQRLADGECWMVENLNLAGGTALSADNTNVTSAYISSFTTSNNLTKSGNTIVLPASSTSGFSYTDYSYVYNSGNKTSTCTYPGCYSYYSWDAATLGSGRTISTDNTNAEQSICPKGWKLPSTYNGSGTAVAATDFRALMIGYGGSDSIQSYDSSTNPTGATMYSRIGPGTTPNFLLAGIYAGGSLDSGGSYGGYWSSTSYSSTSSARALDFSSTYVYSAYPPFRSQGRSVRCLYDDRTISDVTYMQDVTPKIVENTATNATATLKDKRDEQQYTVAKLSDGKLWMAENLNLAGGSALSADNTDVTSAYISSFTTSNNLTKNGNTIVLPASSTSGFDTNNYSYVYNSGNKTSTCTSPGCYSYYSWDAATLGSGRTISTDNTNAEQSICPKGWKLPSTYNGSGTAVAATDFRALMIGYGGSDSIQYYDSSTNPAGATMYSRIGPGSIPNFLRAGSYDNGSFYDGDFSGSYWSSMSYSDTNNAHILYLDSANVYSAVNVYRYYGHSVRCLFSS